MALNDFAFNESYLSFGRPALGIPAAKVAFVFLDAFFRDKGQFGGVNQWLASHGRMNVKGSDLACGLHKKR